MNSTGCTLLPDQETLPRRQHCLSSTSLPHSALTVARLFNTVIMCVPSHIQCSADARIIVIILISVVSQSFHLAFALPCLIHFQKIFFFFCFIYLHASFMPTLMGAVAPWTCIGSIHSRVEWSGVETLPKISILLYLVGECICYSFRVTGFFRGDYFFWCALYISDLCIREECKRLIYS